MEEVFDNKKLDKHINQGFDLRPVSGFLSNEFLLKTLLWFLFTDFEEVFKRECVSKEISMISLYVLKHNL